MTSVDFESLSGIEATVKIEQQHDVVKVSANMLPNSAVLPLPPLPDVAAPAGQKVDVGQQLVVATVTELNAGQQPLLTAGGALVVAKKLADAVDQETPTTTTTSEEEEDEEDDDDAGAGGEIPSIATLTARHPSSDSSYLQQTFNHYYNQNYCYQYNLYNNVQSYNGNSGFYYQHPAPIDSLTYNHQTTPQYSTTGNDYLAYYNNPNVNYATGFYNPVGPVETTTPQPVPNYSAGLLMQVPPEKRQQHTVRKTVRKRGGGAAVLGGRKKPEKVDNLPKRDTPISLPSQTISPDSNASNMTTPSSASQPRRRTATAAQRHAANIRERKRMVNLNESFNELRSRVPTFAYERKLSRIETLRLAIMYIAFMTDIVINGKQPHEIKLALPPPQNRHLNFANFNRVANRSANNNDEDEDGDDDDDEEITSSSFEASFSSNSNSKKPKLKTARKK